MSDFGRSMGSNWLQGPYYSTTGISKWAITPVSKLPWTGAVGAGIIAFRAGWWLGGQLDQHFGLSNRASDFMFDRTPSSIKWWIHDHF
jgi:hypothetical protein